MPNKIGLDQLEFELKSKNLTLKSSYDDYQSINSSITVECLNGHQIHTSLKTIRSKNFTCNLCVGSATKGDNMSSLIVPEKTGHRIIGFDNASHNMGVAIFDSGKLVFYKLLQFNQGTTVQRLNKIRDVLETQIIPEWQPDIIQIEGIQHQASYATYEVLTKLQGIFEMAADRFGVTIEKDRSSTWRSHFNINRRKREDDKKAAIDLVKDMYDIEVTDDIAEAILIAKYRFDMTNKGKIQNLF